MIGWIKRKKKRDKMYKFFFYFQKINKIKLEEKTMIE